LWIVQRQRSDRTPKTVHVGRSGLRRHVLCRQPAGAHRLRAISTTPLRHQLLRHLTGRRRPPGRPVFRAPIVVLDPMVARYLFLGRPGPFSIWIQCYRWTSWSPWTSVCHGPIRRLVFLGRSEPRPELRGTIRPPGRPEFLGHRGANGSPGTSGRSDL